MRVALSNFTGGEISSILSARCDLSRYKNSVQCVEKALPTASEYIFSQVMGGRPHSPSKNTFFLVFSTF